MSSLWNHLGFVRNPYFATPIEVSKEGADLFVGRGEEIRRLVNKWDEPNGCTTIVGGNIGTGKTSFLNVCQYLSLTGSRQFGLPYEPPQLVPAYHKVQLSSSSNHRDLLSQILWAAARSFVEAGETLGFDPPAICQELINWLGSTELAQSHSSSGGATVAGTGFTVGSSSSSQLRPQADASTQLLEVKLAELAQAAADTRPFRGLIVAIDNIEFVHTEELMWLLNQYRDTLFSTRKVWWVLIGQRGLFDLVNAESPRVAQRIKGTETTLEGLSWTDFHLAVSARLDHFRTRKDAAGPLDDELLRTLFDASAGEIRYVFKMADQIVSDALARDPSVRNVDPELATEILSGSVGEQLDRLGLTSREVRVLKEVAQRASVRPKEYKELGFQNAPHFIQSALQPLQEKGLLSKATQGNAAVYSLRPLGILADRFGLLSQTRKAPN